MNEKKKKKRGEDSKRQNRKDEEAKRIPQHTGSREDIATEGFIFLSRNTC